MRYGIALGSNLGARLENLRRAVSLLTSGGEVRLLAAAPVYETQPVDCAPGSGAFYNSVIEVESDLGPHELLRTLLRIEAELGRPNAHGFHEPRSIDLDLLYAGDSRVDDATLTLPHPRIARRRFVMQPLADIRPQLKLPDWETDAAGMLALLGGDPPVRVTDRAFP